MRTRIVPLLLAALPGGWALAQEDRAAQAAQQYQALVEEVREAQQKAVQDYLADAEKEKAAAAAEGRQAKLPGFDMSATLTGFAPRFEEGAKAYAGTDGAVPFLLWLVSSAPGNEARGAALDTLLAAHIGSGKLASLPRALGYYLPDRAPAALDLLVEKSPHDDVKAEALLARGSSALRDDTPEDSPAAQAGIADLRRAAEIAKNPGIAARAQGALREKLLLRIGKEAPDIEGKDLDDVAFKLSDYRGKVVVLDFWGDW